MASTAKKYRILKGVSWYDDNRAEPGEIRSDIPAKSVGWLIEDGAIEEYVPRKKKAAADGV